VAQPYVGEIRMFGGNFAPAGWMFCEGQLLPISQNDTLFQLIGTTYGGDGQSTFALPDLRGRLPVHQGNGFVLAQTGGAEGVTLTTNQTPAHAHPVVCSADLAQNQSPQNQVLAQDNLTPQDLYSETETPTQPMATQALNPVGGSQPHTNLQPYLCVNFILSLFGLFPSPT
jgi:microcystin-dependent protein